ncbi:MAG: hypothetical protein AB7O57_21270 [Hyphomicrobiaceae bacterium]
MTATRLAAIGAGAVIAVAAATPVTAQIRTPYASCETSDFNISLRMELPLALDGSGSPGEKGLSGTLEIHHQKVAKDRRLWSLDGKRPAQIWNRDGQFKMMLRLGLGEDAIMLIIDTAQRDAQGEHTGSFRLIAGEVRVTGRIACSVG